MEFNHQVSTETYVDTTKWDKSSGGTAKRVCLRLRNSAVSSRETIPDKTE